MNLNFYITNDRRQNYIKTNLIKLQSFLKGLTGFIFSTSLCQPILRRASSKKFKCFRYYFPPLNIVTIVTDM